MKERFEQSNESGETNEFKNNKRNFFINLGLRARENLKMHKEAGLWQRNEGKRDWGNVSEHCLVEAARAEIFAEKLGLSQSKKRDLVSGAILHDFDKRRQIELFNEEGITWSNYQKSEEDAQKLLERAGFNKQIIRLVGSIGLISLEDIEKVLSKEKLSQEDITVLVLHYIDDYTSGSDWAKPSEINQEGKKINDVNKRMGKVGERYKELGKEGVKFFGFKDNSIFDAEIRIGHVIEKRLAEMINQKNNSNIEPEDLPEFIDNEIRNKIESSRYE